MTHDDVEQLARVYPDVPLEVLGSVLAMFRRMMPAVSDVRAARIHVGATEAAKVSSIGSHVDKDGTSVAVYLTQHDVDLISLGFPVDLRAPDTNGGTLSVHVRRERRRVPRTPPAEG